MPEEYKPHHVSAQADERLSVVPVSANDNLDAYLDREIASWTVDDLPDAPVLTNLDGTPCDPDPAPAPLAGNPQNGTARSRASFARDRRNLHVIKDFEPDARSSRTKWQKPSLVADTPFPSHTPSKATQKRRQADENDTRKPQPWSRTTEIIKGHAYVRTVSTRGAGLSWTLNLGGKVAQAANDNPEGLKEKLHDRLSKALKASPLGTRDFVFGIETTKAGRWHLHGVLDATKGELAQVEEVLRKAGGVWGSAHHQDRQAHARTVVWGPDGWARYLLKGSAKTRRLLGTKSVLSVTRGCRQRAEALWEASRRDHQEIHKEPRQRAEAPVWPETAPEPAAPACETSRPTRGAVAAHGEQTGLVSASWACTSAFETISPRPMTAARSRDPPGPSSRLSAGPDPPLPERRFIGQVYRADPLESLLVLETDWLGHANGFWRPHSSRRLRQLPRLESALQLQKSFHRFIRQFDCDLTGIFVVRDFAAIAPTNQGASIVQSGENALLVGVEVCNHRMTFVWWIWQPNEEERNGETVQGIEQPTGGFITSVARTAKQLERIVARA